eukprot:g990.t1
MRVQNQIFKEHGNASYFCYVPMANLQPKIVHEDQKAQNFAVCHIGRRRGLVTNSFHFFLAAAAKPFVFSGCEILPDFLLRMPRRNRFGEMFMMQKIKSLTKKMFSDRCRKVKYHKEKELPTSAK